MRIGVIGDTHRDIESARTAINLMGKIDLLLHTGDHYDDAQLLAEEFGVKTKAVIGNCDYALHEPLEQIIKIDGEILLLTHGHNYNVKFGLQRLYYRALEIGATIVAFGHTHSALFREEGKITFLNPGSTSLPRGADPSCAVIECLSKRQIKILHFVK